MLIIFLPLLSYIFLATFTIVLTIITWLRQHLSSSSPGADSIINTALYCGRVSHTRFQPVIHSFSYPLFFCLVDLSEVKDLFHKQLWPLNILMTFRNEDHLKNGEGLIPTSDVCEKNDNSLSCRIRRLVSERTNGKFNPKPEQKIMILTHLCYFGYCFNPVSFYYILKDNQLDDCRDESIDAVVAEVSNTPWNEMRCYVLHPDSCDMQVVTEGRSRKSDESKTQKIWKSVNYVFNKKFHVSPFMEMNYTYDWTFWQFKRERIIVNTLMIKKRDKDEKELDDNGKSFSAFFDIRRSSFSPFSLCYQLLKFPVYCFIIQIWIHYEALKLFWKGVEFIPHPEGSETRASAIIAAVMAPFFAFKEWSSQKMKKMGESKQKSE